MGWRIAKIEDLDIKGLEDIDPADTRTGFVLVPIAEGGPSADPPTDTVTLLGGGQALDYSGFYGKLAFTVYWNPPDRF